ncbi:MAG: hypothetical protein LQ343_006391 [Gyalolechia ehrenbergii]|nr:MAG: hypothetical protein LQ343_006391 [Gyalolechia ehrenbergii]
MSYHRELKSHAEERRYSDTSSIASDRSAATTSDSYATCKSQQNTPPTPRCSWSVLESHSADPQHQSHEASPFTRESLDLYSIARLEDELGYGSDCENEYEGVMPLADYDQSLIGDDTQDHLHEYLHELHEQSMSSTENQNLYATEPVELSGKQLGHTTSNEASPSLDEEAMGTGAVDPLPDLEAAIEDWPPLPPDFLDVTIGNYGFALLPQPPQNQNNPSDTIDNDDLVQLHASTSGLGTNGGADSAQLYPSGDVPLETLDGNGSIENAEAYPDQPYSQIPSWWYFSPHNDLRNMSFVEYLRFWSDSYALQQSTPPNQSDFDGYSFPPLTAHGIYRGMRDRLENQVTKSEVIRGVCDAQGLVWDNFGASRLAARKIRRETYFNQANCFPSYPYAKLINHKPMFCSAPYVNTEARAHTQKIPNTEQYFHFSRMDLGHKISVPHFQLHHTISVSSKNAIFFPTASQDEDGKLNTGSHITCLNPDVSNSSLIIDSANIDPHSNAPRMQKIFTLTAQNDILLAGGLDGEYAMKSLSSHPSDHFVAGLVSDAENTSINHIHTYLDRCSGLPRAVLSSNDCYTHILDCMTNTFLSHHNHVKQVNCAATSPHNRLRVLVRDAKHPLLVEADTGNRVAKLTGHSDFGFACDWSGDGVHFATGAQDGLVNIYDVRVWRKPVKTFKAELGGVRSLTFSPLGGDGPPVLVMAEAADFVHVVGGTKWMEGQTMDFFGEVAGVSFEPEGERFWVGVADPEVGGLMEFERNKDGGFGRSRRSRRNRRWRGDVLRGRTEGD